MTELFQSTLRSLFMEFIKLQAGDYLVKNGTYYQVCSEEELLDLLSPASKK